jgi:DNA-binding SARP family transcriptional activator
LHGTAVADDLTLDRVPADALDLLPGWYDDWVIIERERIRQRVLHAMEALCRQLTLSARYDEALAVARAAIAAEPLRESAQRVLLETLLATGCPSEAWEAYTAFADLVRSELGVEPSRSLTAMVSHSRSLPLAVSQ